MVAATPHKWDRDTMSMGPTDAPVKLVTDTRACLQRRRCLLCKHCSATGVAAAHLPLALVMMRHCQHCPSAQLHKAEPKQSVSRDTTSISQRGTLANPLKLASSALLCLLLAFHFRSNGGPDPRLSVHACASCPLRSQACSPQQLAHPLLCQRQHAQLRMAPTPARSPSTASP